MVPRPRSVTPHACTGAFCCGRRPAVIGGQAPLGPTLQRTRGAEVYHGALRYSAQQLAAPWFKIATRRPSVCWARASTAPTCGDPHVGLRCLGTPAASSAVLRLRDGLLGCTCATCTRLDGNDTYVWSASISTLQAWTGHGTQLGCAPGRHVLAVGLPPLWAHPPAPPLVAAVASATRLSARARAEGTPLQPRSLHR